MYLSLLISLNPAKFVAFSVRSVSILSFFRFRIGSMSVPPRFRSTDSGERDFRSVLGPTGNKLQRKPPGMKLENKKKTTTTIESKDEKTKKKPDPPASPTTTLKQCSSLCSSLLRKNSASMTASYSSDASSSCESSHLSVASSSSCKKAVRRSGSVSSVGACARRKQVDEKDDKVGASGGSNGDCFADGRRRCAWITPKAGENLLFYYSYVAHLCAIASVDSWLIMLFCFCSC